MNNKINSVKSGDLQQININQIKKNKDNPRIIFRSKEMENLLLSISQIGIQVPITVYKEGNHFVLIDGERRWKCATKLGHETIPALIQKKPSQLENLRLMFNIHALREQWDLLTIALKLPTIIDLLKGKSIKPTEQELAKFTGLTQGTIRRSKSLMALPKKYKLMILTELEKPKSKQKLSEDFFIEMEKCIKTVKKYLPDAIDNVEHVRSIIIKKYNNDIITNVLHLRYISKIARAEKVGETKSKSRKVLKRLFEFNKYSAESAYEDSVEWAYDKRNFLNRIEWLLETLQSHKNDIYGSKSLINKLNKLKIEIDRFMEEN